MKQQEHDLIKEGRMYKSSVNMVCGIFFRIVTLLTAFIVRTVFIKCLNDAYLSVNGLYSSILSMLSLAELGFGTAMVYSMYKPLAEKDYNKLSQIMRLYKKIYTLIGLFILVIGLLLIPFLDNIIKNKPDIPNLTFYYLLFLFNSVISYLFFAYRNSILQADQRDSVISNYSSVFNIIKTIFQIVLLILFKSFTIYLLTQMVCTIAQNIALAIKVKNDYPVFSHNSKEELPQKEKRKIFNDVKALMIQKVSFKILNTSDSLIISAFVGVNWVGLLSNYLLIIDAIVATVSQLFGAITASLGNYFVKESKESGHQLFLKVDFINFWIYGFCSITLLVLINPFIKLWIGNKYCLAMFVVISLVFRFFIEGYMNMMSTFRSTMGLFTQGKYFPLIVALINIVLSIALSFPFGIAGVIIATPLARCCINVWYMPLVIYKYGFNRSVLPYYIKFIKRILLLVVISCLLVAVSYFIFSGGITIIKFILMIIIIATIPNLVFYLAFYKTNEFKYFYSIVKSKFKK